MKLFIKSNDIYMREGKAMINNNLQISKHKQPQNKKIQLVIGVLVLFGIWCLGFGFSPAVADGYLSDPMTLGVGARALGMGRAYVGIAEDGDAVFINPAGIAQATSPKLSSMYSSVMGDTSYMVVGGVYPFGEKSALGAGYIGSSVDNIPLTDGTGASTGTGRWANNVMFLSYGTYLSALPLHLNLGRDVLLGGSLKYFNVGGQGNASVEAGAGSGIDMDLGLLSPVTDYASIGLNLQNALPGSIGKITKVSGAIDTIPATLKLGTKITLIGKDGQSLIRSDSRKLLADFDYDYRLGGLPGVTHVGLEFWPTSNLALRGGLDGSNYTAGVGIRFAGIEFDYAYHPQNMLAEDTTQYFSFSYIGEPRQRQLLVKITEPSDKSIIYEDHVTVKGKVEVIEGDEPVNPNSPITLKLNGINVAVNPDKTFSADLPVENYGKKLVVAEVSDSSGVMNKEEFRLVRLTSFADVPDGYWAKAPIENTATVALVEGYPDKTFRPENTLTRAELATILVRAKGIKVPEGKARQVFKDVKSDFWAAKYIDIAQKQGLVKGYPDKTFRPNNKINKVEGIAVISRFDQLRLAEVDAKPYWDVPTNHWGAKYVQAAKDAGLLKFVERNKLYPKEGLARAETIEMFAKTQLADGKIKDLYSWEKGFKPEMIRERPQIKASINHY